MCVPSTRAPSSSTTTSASWAFSGSSARLVHTSAPCVCTSDCCSASAHTCRNFVACALESSQSRTTRAPCTTSLMLNGCMKNFFFFLFVVHTQLITSPQLQDPQGRRLPAPCYHAVRGAAHWSQAHRRKGLGRECNLLWREAPHPRSAPLRQQHRGRHRVRAHDHKG